MRRAEPPKELDAFRQALERSHAETRRLLLKDTGEWEHRAIATITPPEIQRLLEHVRDGDDESGAKARPYLAVKIYGLLNTFFAWCAKPSIDLFITICVSSDCQL